MASKITQTEVGTILPNDFLSIRGENDDVETTIALIVFVSVCAFLEVAYSYTYELRPYLDLLLQMLLLEDSWQNHRIHNALKGIPDDRDGLFDTIQRSKNHYQKRAYQCIKMMVALFTHCAPAAQMLQSNGDLKRKWSGAVDWLTDELERRPYPGNAQYTYNNWSPPAQSNETSNGYFLERSQSARITLAKAYELCPEEEAEEGELTDEQEGGNPEEPVPGYSPQQPSNPPQQQQQQQQPSHQQPSQQHVQNNQIHMQPVAHPVQPSNQINNQLNQQGQVQAPPPGQQSPPTDNQETGEEGGDNSQRGGSE